MVNRRAKAGWRQALALLAALAAATLLLAFTPVLSLGQEPPSGPPEVDRDPGGAPYAVGELLVAFEDEAAAGAVAREEGAEVEKTIEEIGAGVLSFPEIENERAGEAREQGLERARQALERNPAVRSADYNYVAETFFTPNDPRFDEQWGLEKIRTERAWDNTRGGNVRVGVVDSGVQRGHPDLGEKVVGARDFTGSGSPEDTDGHGTHVAGIAAAVTDNGEGVAGSCPNCGLLIAKSLDGGRGTIGDIVDGIAWTVRNGADVVNLSLGTTGNAQSFEDAVDFAWNQGAVVTAASGNSGDNTVFYPAAYGNAMGTAATDEDDRRAGFSTWGRSVDIAAPGTRILSTDLGGDYSGRSGTSMAAPHVAGLAALIAAQGRNNAQIRTRIENTAEDIGSEAAFGAGRIDAARAVFKPPYRQVVDNAEGDRFSASGAWNTGRNNSERFREDFRFTRPASVNDPAAFKVRVPRRGDYDVFGWWPSASNYNNRTIFRINTVGGVETRAVNQRRIGGRWVKLGTYDLRRGDRFSVRVQRNTSGTGAIMADAILVREAQ